MPRIFEKKAGTKVAFVLLASFLFLFLAASATLAATYGDINDDGEINVQDVALVMKHVLEIEELTDAEQAVADVNGDSEIDVKDVTLIMQYSLGLIEEFPHAALTVSKVTAVNPKQVEVEFSRVLNDQEKAKVLRANFHVGLQASPGTNRLTGTGAAVAIKEDNKTVILTMGDGHVFVNGSTTNRVIVKKALGLDEDYTNSSVAFADTTIPALVSVESVSPTLLVLTFSEPLDKGVTPSNITLNDGAIALNLSGATYVDAQRELRINTYSALSAGTYTLAIKTGTSLKDYSGYGVVPVSKTFTHTPVTTPPTVSVKSSTESTVTLEFSREIAKNSLDSNANVLFRHTYDSTANQVTGTSVTNPSVDSKTFVIDFDTKLLPPGTTTLWMKYANDSGTKVKDTWGNVIAPFELSVTVTADTTAPTATVTAVSGSSTKIDVQYSEKVTGAETISNYSLKKGSTTVSIGSVADQLNNKYLITTSAAMQGEYTLTISNIKDTSPAQNAMGTQTYTITVKDIIKPYVVKQDGTAGDVFYRLTPDKEVRIFFSEPMNATDLANKQMYENVADGNNNPTTATAASDGKSVYLKFANAVTGKIRVGPLKDVAGNALGMATELSGEVFTFGLSSKGVVATSPTSISVYLNGVVNTISTDDFEINIKASDWVNPSSIAHSIVDGKSVLKLTLDDAHKLGYDAKSQDTTPKVVKLRTKDGSAAASTKDAYGFPVTIAAKEIADKIPPEVEKITFNSATKITVKLKEHIKAGSMSTDSVNGFSVSGGNLTKAVYAGSGLEIELTGSGFTKNTDVTYNSAAGITDVAGNKLASFSWTKELTTTP